MAGRLSEWPILAPAGHPAVNQLRVPGLTVFRTQSQTLGDAGTESFKQGVRGLHQPQHCGNTLRLLKVHGNGFPISRQHVSGATGVRLDAIHPDDLGTQHAFEVAGQAFRIGREEMNVVKGVLSHRRVSHL